MCNASVLRSCMVIVMNDSSNRDALALKKHHRDSSVVRKTFSEINFLWELKRSYFNVFKRQRLRNNTDS